MEATSLYEGSNDTKTMSDSLYYVNGFNSEDGSRLADGSNGDLWKLSAEKKVGRHKVEKVKAHAEDAVLRGKMDVNIYLQNLVADAGAGCMADILVDSCHALAIEKS